MENMTWNIRMIEAMSEDDARALAVETHDIKGFTVYLVDFSGAFGFSALVFKNSHHIRFADDYALHHSKELSRDELKDWYLKALTDKLFTDEELFAPLKDYDEYRRKYYFLSNYHNMQVDNLSIFGFFNGEDCTAEYEEKKKGFPYYNPVSFCYMADKGFVDHEKHLADVLDRRKEEMSDNYEYHKSAFLFEMANHEYAINYQADYDTLSAFGNVGWHGDNLDAYFKELKFTDTQKKAYLVARRETLRKAA